MDALQMAEHKRMSSLCRNQRAEQKVYEKTLQYESAKEKFEKKVFDKALRCESAKKKLEKKITELQVEFAKPPKEGGARLFTKNQLKDSYAALTVCMFQITPARATLKMHTDLQDTARQQLVALRFITNEYKSKKDKVWLEKAVHLACESKNPSSEHIAPIPKPEQPVTAW
jgi:hypothetical protein